MSPARVYRRVGKVNEKTPSHSFIRESSLIPSRANDKWSAVMNTRTPMTGNRRDFAKRQQRDGRSHRVGIVYQIFSLQRLQEKTT